MFVSLSVSVIVAVSVSVGKSESEFEFESDSDVESDSECEAACEFESDLEVVSSRQGAASAASRDGYNFESGTSFGICVVVAVGSALVVLVLGAVGGALEFPLVSLSGDVENPFRDIYL